MSRELHPGKRKSRGEEGAGVLTKTRAKKSGEGTPSPKSSSTTGAGASPIVEMTRIGGEVPRRDREPPLRSDPQVPEDRRVGRELRDCKRWKMSLQVNTVTVGRL